jgi:hypothetical protein
MYTVAFSGLEGLMIRYTDIKIIRLSSHPSQSVLSQLDLTWQQQHLIHSPNYDHYTVSVDMQCHIDSFFPWLHILPHQKVKA